MTLFLDARIPVRFGALSEAGPDSALLIEGEDALPASRAAAGFTMPVVATGHPAGCACCAPRTPVCQALSRLFLARARGDAAFFRDVVAITVTAAGQEAVLRALIDDPLVSAWFRLADARPESR
ncbi:MAG TPA: hypothetical protein VIZ17_19705 [Acetobacteraceae bacterium]